MYALANHFKASTYITSLLTGILVNLIFEFTKRLGVLCYFACLLIAYRKHIHTCTQLKPAISHWISHAMFRFPFLVSECGENLSKLLVILALYTHRVEDPNFSGKRSFLSSVTIQMDVPNSNSEMKTTYNITRCWKSLGITKYIWLFSVDCAYIIDH